MRSVGKVLPACSEPFECLHCVRVARERLAAGMKMPGDKNRLGNLIGAMDEMVSLLQQSLVSVDHLLDEVVIHDSDSFDQRPPTRALRPVWQHPSEQELHISRGKDDSSDAVSEVRGNMVHSPTVDTRTVPDRMRSPRLRHVLCEEMPVGQWP